VPLELCPRTSWIFDPLWWNNQYMVNYDPWGGAVVPMYANYVDLGAPYAMDYYYRMKKTDKTHKKTRK